MTKLGEPIARTALLTAAARARETEREGGLAKDPFARLLAGDEGMRMLDAQADPRPLASLAVRSRFIDDALTEALAGGARVVLLLAAGLDARAYRMPVPEGVAWLEIDRDEVLAHKRRLLAREVPNVTPIDVGADLRDADLGALLTAAGVPPHPRAFVAAEGLFPYLDERDARSLLARVAGAVGPGSLVVFDVPSAAMLDASGPMARHLAELAASGAPWRFGTDAPATLAEDAGFDADVVHVGHPRAHYGRLATPPSEAPRAGAPVTWLVRARRRGA